MCDFFMAISRRLFMHDAPDSLSYSSGFDCQLICMPYRSILHYGQGYIIKFSFTHSLDVHTHKKNLLFLGEMHQLQASSPVTSRAQQTKGLWLWPLLTLDGPVVPFPCITC